MDFVVKTQFIVETWTEPHIIVTRYFFSFLHDLSQYSEAAQMGAHNLAVCFGPTLCPIPVGKDLVQFRAASEGSVGQALYYSVNSDPS